MTFTLQDTVAAVLARLGMDRGTGLTSATSSPSDADIVSDAIRAMLPSTGGMVAEASADDVMDGDDISPEVTFVETPCGLFAAVMPLGPDVVRICTVKMKGWSRPVASVTPSSSPAAARIWSPEQGIAGSPSNPAAYLTAGPSGLTLHAMASADRADRLEYLKVWKTPSVTPDGRYSFPARLHPLLIDRLSDSIGIFRPE